MDPELQPKPFNPFHLDMVKKHPEVLTSPELEESLRKHAVDTREEETDPGSVEETPEPVSEDE